jgi:WD40 repeat protein
MRDNIRTALLCIAVLLFAVPRAIPAQQKTAGQGRLLIQNGHLDSVEEIAYSPDGKRLASASLDGKVKIWDPLKGLLLADLEGHNGGVRTLAFSPDGRTLASADESGMVILWNAATGAEAARFNPHGRSINMIRYSPEGALLATASSDTTVKLVNPSNGAIVRSLESHSDDVGCCAFSPDGRTLATGSDDGVIILWNVADGAYVSSLECPKEHVLSLCFSPDGRTLAAGYFSMLRFWDWSNGVQKAAHESDYLCMSLCYSGDGARLLVGCDDNRVRLIDAETHRVVGQVNGHSDGVRTVSWSPDGKSFASAGLDWAIRTWPTASIQESVLAQCPSEDVLKAVFSPNGNLVALSGQADSLVVADAKTGVVVRTIKGLTPPVFGVAFTRDGGSVLVATDRVTAYDVSSGTERVSYAGAKGTLLGLDVSPDGALVAAGGAEGTLYVWNARSGSLIRGVPAHKEELISVRFSPDGKAILTAGQDGALRLWDALKGTKLGEMPGHAGVVYSAVFSPDGKTIASGGMDDGIIRLWDPVKRALIRESPPQPYGLTSLSFSPDGKYLATSGMGPTVKIRDAASLTEVTSLGYNERRVWSVAFSPDGRKIAYTSKHNEGAFICALGSCLSSQTLASLTAPLTCLAADPRSGRIAVGNNRAEIAVWDLGNLGAPLTLSGYNGQRDAASINAGAMISCLAFSPDGARLASASIYADSNRLEVWNLAEKSVASRFLCADGDSIHSVAFDPSSMLGAFASGKDIKIWDTSTGAVTTTIKAHSDFVRSVCFSRIAAGTDTLLFSGGQDGKLIAYGDLSSKEPQQMPISTSVRPIFATAVAPSCIAAAGLYGLATYVVGDPDLKTVPVNGSARSTKCLAFNGSGNRLLSAGTDRLVHIWAPIDRKELATLTGHAGEVSGVASFAGDRVYVTASADSTIKIWNAKTNACILTLLAFDGGGYCAYTDDGVYDCSPGIERFLTFGQGLAVEPAATSKGIRRSRETILARLKEALTR